VGAAARRKTREEEMKLYGDEDILTTLSIKAAFEARLVQEVARSSRSSAPLSVMVVDVDNMDAINERAGRHGGDEALRAIAHSLIQGMRGSDGVFRYGGDEFAAVLPDTDVATAHMAAERCRVSIADLDVTGGPVSVSIGVAEYSTGRKAEEIVAKAEIALFRAKESGGNRCWRSDDPRKHGINPTSLSQELTDREWAVLAHLANRRTEADIARRLNIRAGTVRSHKARIRRKLHVDPDIRLVDFARTNFRDLIGRLDTIDEQAG
jgi:diguanylate cyclase (GGDEF)-like protein